MIGVAAAQGDLGDGQILCEQLGGGAEAGLDEAFTAWQRFDFERAATAPGWYNKSTGAFQQASDGTANTFQVTTEVTYDALGNATRNRVRVSNTGTAATDYVDSYKTYDAVGHVVHEIDALSGVTAYTYDKLGNALTIKRHASALNFAVPALGYYLVLPERKRRQRLTARFVDWLQAELELPAQSL